MINISASTYRLVAGVLLAAICMLIGAWRGYSQVQDSLLPAPVASNSKAVVPRIPLPPPIYIADVAEPPKTRPSASNASAPLTGGANEEIQPAGVGDADRATDLLWETTASQPWQVRPQPITPPNWYITGVVRRGEQTQVIVQFDGEPMPRMFKVGDTLPGGARLGWVRPNAIGVITATKKTLDVPVLGGDPASSGKPAKPASRNSTSTSR